MSSLHLKRFCDATKVITQFELVKEISINALLSCFVCIFAAIFSTSLQLALSFSFEELNRDWRDLRLEPVSTNGLKVCNHWIIFTRSTKSLLFCEVPSSTCCSLAVCFDPEIVLLLLELQHICVLIAPTHTHTHTHPHTHTHTHTILDSSH